MVRHAQTTWNDAGRVQGQADPPLSATGERQCDLLRARFDGFAPDRLYTSDLGRAARTAAAIPGPATPRPGLREVDLGEWEGKTQDELRTGWPDLYARWQARPSWDLVPGGEGQVAFESRCRLALQECLEGVPDGATVVLVTHIGVIRTLLCLLVQVSMADLRWPWAIENTSLTTLVGPAAASAWQGDAVTVRAVNDTSHLARIGGTHA